MPTESFKKLRERLLKEHENIEGSLDLQGSIKDELLALTPLNFSIKRVAELLHCTRSHVGQLIKEVYNLRWFNGVLSERQVRFYPKENKWVLINPRFPMGETLTKEEVEYLYICCTCYNSMEKEDYILYNFNGV